GHYPNRARALTFAFPVATIANVTAVHMRRYQLASMSVLVLAVATLTACKKKEGRAKRMDVPGDGSDAAGSAKAAPLGPALGDVAVMRLAIYYPAKPVKSPRAELERLLAANQPVIPIVTDLTATPPLPFAFYGEPAIADYAPPPADSMQYFVRGLSDAEMKAFGASQFVAAIGFETTGADALAQLRRSQRLVAEVAATTGGVIWSDDVRVAFSAKAWDDRTTAAETEAPDIEELVTVHAYQSETNAGVRQVTLGLDQLALPDLVVEDATKAEGERAAFTINLVAQLLAEGAQPAEDGSLSLAISDIKNSAARERMKARIGTGGTGKATVRLLIGERDDGDAENRLWRIDFPGTGAYPERLASTVANLFGREDGAYGAASGDAELVAASHRAKAELVALRPRFVKGLPDGDHLLIKAPFATDGGGTEYMWLEVRAWKGGRIEGILTDEPFQISALHAGAPVEVAQTDVFDYILAHRDGTSEGNHTTPILEKRGTKWP
ncbi:MAG TPA: DUF2314 domain-containing protein, partial [Kofleriaceae bacterium]|nr:DUF2314 domain-containing protein [Kofleriaceae bacterium]